MIIHDLQDAYGVAEKLAILRRATDLEQKLFLYTYSKEKSYGVKAPRAFSVDMDVAPQPEMFELLDKLNNREVTGHAAKRLVEEYASLWGGLIYVVLNRKLGCSVAVSLINKALPGCVPVFSLQLAKEKPLDQVKFPCLAQLKYDGVRIAITWDGTDLKFRTRNGKAIELPGVTAMLDLQCSPPPFMLDTEVVLKGGTMEDRPKVSGMINSARQGGRIDESLLQFFVFDGMPYDVFRATSASGPYSQRLKYAQAIINILQRAGTTVLELAETNTVDSAMEAQCLFEATLAKGQEGLILKPADHLYTFRRSADWIKMKATNSAELECVAIQEGTGKYTGMIGALNCEGRVRGMDVSVRVGTGLSDQDRELDPSEYIGKQIEVLYNSVIQNSTSGKHSLFLPRFWGIRHDK